MTAVAGICFDFDGTLAEFHGDFSEYLDDLRLDLNLLQCDFRRFRDALAAELSRNGAITLAGALAVTLQQLELREIIDDRLMQSALDAYARQVALLPGTAELLQACSERVPLALISNGPADMQRAAITASGIEPFFSAILVSGDADVAVRKPDPLLFELARTRLDANANALLMVGDDPVADILGAHNAGWQVLHVGPGGAAAKKQEILGLLG